MNTKGGTGDAAAAVAAHAAKTDGSAHGISGISGLQTALDGKQVSGSYATATQGAKADSALQSGAAISNIAGLQTALDGKQASGSYEAAGTAISAVSAHAAKTDGSAHGISGISGLQTALDGKQAADTNIQAHISAVGNTHGLTAGGIGSATAQWNADKLQGVPVSSTTPAAGQVLKYDGAAWAPGADIEGAGVGVGAVTSVAGRTGAVVLAPPDVGLGNVANTAQVTGVGGTAPIASSGGLAPVISISAATASAAGSMSAAHFLKLEGVAANATAYSHPANHAATMITQDSTHSFITDAERTEWNSSISRGVRREYLSYTNASGNIDITITPSHLGKTIICYDTVTDNNIIRIRFPRPSQSTGDWVGLAGYSVDIIAVARVGASFGSGQCKLLAQTTFWNSLSSTGDVNTISTDGTDAGMPQIVTMMIVASSWLAAGLAPTGWNRSYVTNNGY